MFKFFDWVKAQFFAFLDWLYNLAVAAVSTLFAMLKDVGLWLFEQLLDLVTVILGALSFDLGAFDAQQYLGQVGADVLNVMGLVGIDTAVSVIVAAILVRVLLQLVPFTRLGS